MFKCYGTTDYWEDRYRSKESQFDWYLRLEDILVLKIKDQETRLDQLITPESKILNIGAGNSRKQDILIPGLAEELFDEGYQNITNVDFSPSVVNQMKEKYKDKGSGFIYDCQDLKAMTNYQDESFDFIIDKATLDSILCAENARQQAEKVIFEVFRVLKDHGTYMLITNSTLENRMKYFLLDRLKWNVSKKFLVKNAYSEISKTYQVILVKKMVKPEEKPPEPIQPPPKQLAQKPQKKSNSKSPQKKK